MRQSDTKKRQSGASMRQSNAKIRQSCAKMRQYGAKMRHLGPSRRHLEPSWLELASPKHFCISRLQKCYKVCKSAISRLQKCYKVCNSGKSIVTTMGSQRFGVSKTQYVCHFFLTLHSLWAPSDLGPTCLPKISFGSSEAPRAKIAVLTSQKPCKVLPKVL